MPGNGSEPISRRSPWQVERERLQHEVTLLREELRIKDARMAGIPPTRRPHYSSTDRLAILELRAARSWSLTQTAQAFLITPQTISEWLRRIDEQGTEALVQLSEPVNKFPQLVGYLVRRLKTLCPTLGTKKIAESLARAGLHLGATTVRRMIQASSSSKPVEPEPSPAPNDKAAEQVVTAQSPNQVWHMDLTTVPIAGGFWTAWLPFSLPQCWPFCLWLAVVVDHHSRRIMGFATFKKQPTSADVQHCMARAIRQAGATPKHIICDSGTQFACPSFKKWCKRRRIRPRYGAIGKHGSIAVVERVILTLKQLLACLIIVPLSQGRFRHEVALLVQWYNEYRPHTSLHGRTPNEVYDAKYLGHWYAVAPVPNSNWMSSF